MEVSRPVGDSLPPARQVAPAASYDNWWEVFQDKTLDSLERLAMRQNQDLKTAEGIIRQSQANLRVAQAGLYPSFIFSPSASTNRLSPNRPNPFTGSKLSAVTINTFQLPINFNYEVDLWGKYRSAIQAGQATVEANTLDLKFLQLGVAGDVATNYFTLALLDAQLVIADSTTALRVRNVAITNARYQGGLTAELDVAQARTELATVQAQRYDLVRQRALVEHALASLCGIPASQFTVAPRATLPDPPLIPAQFSGELLAQRPDVAEAERLIRVANAQIGVAQTAFWPSVILNGFGGTLAQDPKDLLSTTSKTWLLAAGFNVPLFQGGRNSANRAAARAVYEQQLSSYQGAVLGAFQDVEDALANLRQRGGQFTALQRELAAARRSAQLARERYTRGLVTFLDVINADRTVFQSETGVVQLLGQRLVDSVTLVRALGGTWQDR